MKYVFKEGPVTIRAAAKADPQKIGDALTKIAEANGGHLRPNDVVEAARNPRNTLHKHFEWDDAVAAEAYRIEQAREIIRVVRVEADDDERPAPAFLSISDKGGVSYRSLGEVRSSPDLQRIVLEQAQRDLTAFTTRYRELTDVCALVHKAHEKVSERLQTTESRAAA